jgi:hypothetical protein
MEAAAVASLVSTSGRPFDLLVLPLSFRLSSAFGVSRNITTFPKVVFQSLKEAFVSQVSLPVANASNTGDMLCFSTAPAADPKEVAVPKLILHLEGADWDLPRESYLLDVDDDDGTGGGLCVVILSAGENDMTTIIGNFQQQNMHIVYDLDANKMVFMPDLRVSPEVARGVRHSFGMREMTPWFNLSIFN